MSYQECSKLTVKTPGRGQLIYFFVFEFEQILPHISVKSLFFQLDTEICIGIHSCLK